MAIPITIVLDLTNKHNNRLYWGNRLISRGSSGLESVEIRSGNGGKRSFATLVLSDFQLVLLDAGCPESYRFHKIADRIGDAQAIRDLDPVCELILISANACDGCPMRPRPIPGK